MMKAVVLKAPFDVRVEDVPMPKIEKDTDVLIKVTQAGLCGSDLHWYRGHQPQPYNFIVGHETVGVIVETGKAVKDFRIGDKVIAPFSTNCGDCFFCNLGYTSRCDQVQNFGNPAIAGGQAEYFRMPLADSSLIPVPEGVPEDLGLLLTDILPTGYSTAMNARRLLDEDRASVSTGKRGVCVVVGCGPVGLCAISSACTLFERVFATDIAEHRLESARKHGAVALPLDQLRAAVKEATDGRGADAALEVVGHESALRTAMDIVRFYGVISSCGVYTHQANIDGTMLLRFQFGRCSVRTFVPAAIEVLRANQALFAQFVENKITLDQCQDQA